MKCLFIGRFQPFHKGHLQVLRKFKDEYDEIIIGIGSSQYSNNNKNPFTTEERIKMIEKSLEENNIKNYKIRSIPDIHNPPKWVSHVKTIISDFDVVITNNSFTKKLFLENGYKVLKTPIYKREVFSGKEIRRRIKNDEKWNDLVTKSTYDIIMKIDGVNRIKKMNKNNVGLE